MNPNVKRVIREALWAHAFAAIVSALLFYMAAKLEWRVLAAFNVIGVLISGQNFIRALVVYTHE